MPVCLPDGKVAGIITDRDIVVRNLAEDGDPKTTLVKDVMTKNVITTQPDSDVYAVAETLATHKIRRLPVVQNECGFLSNVKEEAMLKSDAYQDKIAWSIFNGVLEYFSTEEGLQWDGLPEPSLLPG